MSARRGGANNRNNRNNGSGGNNNNNNNNEGGNMLNHDFEDDFEEDPEEDIESVISLEIDEDAPQPDYDSEDSVKESSFPEVVCQPCRDDEIAKLKGENALLKLKLKLREEEAEGAKFNLDKSD
nr:PREDICTED: putative uncharacterized protein DDB_G0285495 [Daucus carota subsp. sativus]